ncbi:MAG TPA: WGR domain-containing protein, partial [Myxococcota bacterium]|nr:WGR domain-containing protein [Myxococcota bacterium]
MNELWCVTLRKVDPSKNMARQYSVAVCRDLFGTTVVVCQWGRIGRPGQSSQQVCDSLEEAQALAEELVGKRRRRGYSNAPQVEEPGGRAVTQRPTAWSAADQAAASLRWRAKPSVAQGQLPLLSWLAAAKTKMPSHPPARATAETGVAAAQSGRYNRKLCLAWGQKLSVSFGCDNRTRPLLGAEKDTLRWSRITWLAVS